jgi:hypothetical protein
LYDETDEVLLELILYRYGTCYFTRYMNSSLISPSHDLRALF